MTESVCFNKEFLPLSESLEKRAVVMVSGGLDSVVSLAKATTELDVRLALFFNYGQRALDKEREAVLGVVNYYGVPFREVDLGWLGLLAPEVMRKERAVRRVNESRRLDTAGNVWVPNRNGVFLNVAAAYAESYGCGTVVTGFNREEAEEFPDNKSEYVETVNACLRFSTLSKVRVVSFTQDLAKREILLLGAELRAPLSIIWSCYEGGSTMCGNCASCRKLRAAIDSLPEEKRPHLEFES